MAAPEAEWDEWARSHGFYELTWRLTVDQKRALWARRRDYLTAGRYADDAPINRRWLFARWLKENERIGIGDTGPDTNANISR